MRTRDRVIAMVMPVVLVVVGLSQVTMAFSRDLTPWKGGGFGMFASTDGLNYRAVQVRLLTDTGEIPADIHDFGDLRRANWRFTHARAMPDERRLSRLADRIAYAAWTVEDGVATFDTWLAAAPAHGLPALTRGPDRDPEVIVVTGVVIEVWGAFFTRGSEQVEPRLLGRYERGIEVAATAPQETRNGAGAPPGAHRGLAATDGVVR